MIEQNIRKQVVLFLCTGNSVRSQMAEAFLAKYAGDRFDVISAGLEPVGIHPLTVNVMEEIGFDLSGQCAKGVSQFLGKLSVHFAIFVCEQAEARCPTLWPWALKRLSWPFEDPAALQGTEEQRLHRFRQVRDQIRDKINTWLKEFPATSPSDQDRTDPEGADGDRSPAIDKECGQ